MAKIISFCQNKGGVGKTSTALNLGYLFSKEAKTLLIDLDSQANLSQTFRIFLQEKDKSIKDFIDKPNKKIIRNVRKNLDIIPNDINFEIWKKNSYHKANLSYLLRIALKTIISDYEYILIDCPPSLDLSFDLALYASDYAVILSDGHIYAMQGVDNILSEIRKIIDNDITEKTKLKTLGLVFNRYKKHIIINDIIEVSKTKYDLFKTKIRECVAIPESQSQNLSIFEYDNKSNAVVDYQNLFNEIKDKINEKL